MKQDIIGEVHFEEGQHEQRKDPEIIIQTIYTDAELQKYVSDVKDAELRLTEDVIANVHSEEVQQRQDFENCPQIMVKESEI